MNSRRSSTVLLLQKLQTISQEESREHPCLRSDDTRNASSRNDMGVSTLDTGGGPASYEILDGYIIYRQFEQVIDRDTE